MHALEVITARNLTAAGREAAHAERDGAYTLSATIHRATQPGHLPLPQWGAYVAGYTRGLTE